MNTLKGLGSDIKLRSIKQVSASLLADDDVPDTLLDWTSEFAGQWLSLIHISEPTRPY